MSVKSKDNNKRVILDKKRLIDSFRYAFCGICEAYKGEQNLKIHTVIAVLVVIAGFVLKISYVEWLICLVLIGLVLMEEFFMLHTPHVIKQRLFTGKRDRPFCGESKEAHRLIRRRCGALCAGQCAR